MRTRRNKVSGQIPEVNLVPMMDVMMTVLTFFIIISMSLSGYNIVNVKVPILGGTGVGAAVEKNEPKKLTIGLTNTGQLVLDGKDITVEQMADAMVKFLNENPDGIVILKADSKLKYESVVKVLEVMRDIGGDRVSLAVNREGS
ncbi:MAG TPA: biopolymer transporter ExbD [Leptolyngbyaceae cyanobacterium M33_DOE_097]|uniref:Biopolymer transporter ExbD n=1 Tax=Oscillatoriales cyanobacterium SpSt-418 TaxID=2282169 RepID=A0A7C3KJJ4_9CYAN|nr:biopolymer transporter ExbD [Leptolyngbyaceae cyanobacterium M33_DOE_097]